MTALEINRRIDIAAPITNVWAALTEADLITQWLGDSAEFDAVPGGAGFFGWSEHGKFRLRVEQADKPRLLVYRWARESDTDPVPGNSTVVRIELTEVDGGTRLALLESGFEELENPSVAHTENEGGWTAELGELVEFLAATQ
ncbi:SRPBCC domain-containing protein [Mycobacterium sp. AMU20-3851]|uniref:SRPBCC domain-containing protein n=1 Tax=Mycobacterium sp. AMU20-3851 TaxID=3122055 RepID=UPI0037548309